jgi:hypothetical protein
MNENLNELRVLLAIERGFIPQEANELQVAAGLETMHHAPLNAVGEYALIDSVEVAQEAS